MNQEYVQRGDWLSWDFELRAGHVISLSGKDFYKDRRYGGTAVFAIERNGAPLVWDRLRIESADERGKLAKKAHALLNDVDREVFALDAMTSHLDAFAYGFYRATVRQCSGGLLHGDPDIGPPKPILGGMVIQDGGTMIYAPPGRGKSFTVLAMAVSLDAGVGAVWAVSPRRVGYVNLERSASSMQYRLAQINRALGLDPRRPLAFLNARGKSLADVSHAVTALIEAHQLDGIVLDSISRAGYGKLTEDYVANAIVDTLNGLGGFWIAVAHTPRADETHQFGSVHFEAGEDVGVRLLSQPDNNGLTLGIGLKVTKANDLPTGRLHVHALDFDPAHGLVGIRRAAPSDFPDILAERGMSKADRVGEYLVSVGKATPTQIEKATGIPRTTITDILKAPRFNKEELGRETYYCVRSPNGARP